LSDLAKHGRMPERNKKLQGDDPLVAHARAFGYVCW
jgi:hypothetical protein